MNGKKKRHVILIVLAVVALAAGILGGRELWLYEHPEIQIRFSHIAAPLEFRRAYQRML